MAKLEVRETDERRFKKVVYVQMRYFSRDAKTGSLKAGKTKTITVRNATIAQVEAIIRRGGNSVGESD